MTWNRFVEYIPTCVIEQDVKKIYIRILINNMSCIICAEIYVKFQSTSIIAKW